MKKLSLYCILLLAILFNDCQKKEDIGNPIQELPTEGVLIKTSVFGRIVDEKDEPMSGVVYILMEYATSIFWITAAIRLK